MENLLKALCQEIDFASSDQLIETLSLHWQLLNEANAKFNITAITDEQTAAAKHYLDCLIAGRLLEPYLPTAASAADIGTGGGFPGLVMAAAMPNTRFTLIESAQKKASFLRECAEAMQIEDLHVLSLRAEEAGRAEALRASFDLVTARAVAELAVLSEYALPLLKTGGIFAAMKGPKAEEEIESANNALALLNGKVEQILNYSLPENADSRCLIIIRKTGATPDKYPRRPGMPTKRPL